MTSGNPILDKNLECIEKYNPQLKEELLNLPYLTNKIELIETELKEPNLTFNGLPLHSQKGAEKEAKELFAKVEEDPFSINVIFGIGLGHLFKEFCDYSKSSVVLFEPNLEILRVTLELVDFSKELSQENVRVASDFEQIKKIFSKVYKYKSEINFLFLNSYAHLHGVDKIKSIIKDFEILKGSLKEDYNLLKTSGPEFVSSVVNNLAYSLEATPLKEFKDIYKGKTAVIVSAGPSLDSNIETLKKNRDNIVIFCVGTAIKALMNNGLTPDFLNVLEKADCSGQVKGLDLSNVNLIVEPFVHETFQTLKVKQKFLFPASTISGGKYWSQLSGLDTSDYVAGGSVSYEALQCAKMLGFTKLVLVGQDLAYLDNKCYSGSGSYSDIFFEVNPETNQLEFKIKDMEKFIESCSSVDSSLTREDAEKFALDKIRTCKEAFCYVKGINGDMLPSMSAYAIFAGILKEFASKNQHLQLINTSMRGVQIDGFENMPLEKALENEAVIEKVKFSSDFEYDKKLILKNLNSELNLLKNVLNSFIKSKEYFYKFEREYRHKQDFTNEALKYYKLILELYNEITIEHFENSLLYKLISMHESLELKHFADLTELDLERMKTIYLMLKNYFYNVEAKTLKIIDEFKRQIEIIDANVNSEKSNKYAEELV